MAYFISIFFRVFRFRPLPRANTDLNCRIVKKCHCLSRFCSGTYSNCAANPDETFEMSFRRAVMGSVDRFFLRTRICI